MSRTHRKQKKNRPTAPAVSTSHAPFHSRGKILLVCYLGVGVLLGLGIEGYLHGWFSSSPPTSSDKSSLIAVNAAKAPAPAPAGMVWIPGGTYWMGSEQIEDAKPVHQVAIDGFWMDKTEVTNEQFKKFVEATGYVTVAEKAPDSKQFPQLPPEDLVACSIVFTPPPKAVDPNATQELAWWKMVKGADWRHPEGPQSDIAGRESHPVVHVCYEDAVAFAQWAQKRLPTEAEWEFAARGGLDRKRFCWGEDARPGGKCMANTWQGDFPNKNTLEDGFQGTAPVASFPANGFGLHDMAGNVWEWCSDWYHPKYYSFTATHNPTGPRTSFDPNDPDMPKRVQRGGSFLCAENYCMRYLPGARGKGEPTSSANHIGFRCVRSVTK